MNERRQKRIDVLLEFEREMQEKTRRSREASGGASDKEQSDLARMLRDVDARDSARRRERWRKVRQIAPVVLVLAGLILTALWFVFR